MRQPQVVNDMMAMLFAVEGTTYALMAVTATDGWLMRCAPMHEDVVGEAVWVQVLDEERAQALWRAAQWHQPYESPVGWYGHFPVQTPEERETGLQLLKKITEGQIDSVLAYEVLQ